MERPKACPKCPSQHIIKNGFVEEKQRWQCKECRFSFTRTKPRGKPLALKALCVTLYGMGLAFRGIEKILPASREAVRQWAGRFTSEPEAPSTKDVKVVKVDEMLGYIQQNSKEGNPSKWLLIQAEDWSDFDSATILLTE